MPVSVAMVDGARAAARPAGARAGGRTGRHRVHGRRADPPRRHADLQRRRRGDARGRPPRAPPRPAIDNVEFSQLELEWIDLETASVDAVLCRWGIMLIVDPEAAAHEIRRSRAGRRPGGVRRLGRPGAQSVGDDPVARDGRARPSPSRPTRARPGCSGSRATGVLAGAARGGRASPTCEVDPVALERRYDAIDGLHRRDRRAVAAHGLGVSQSCRRRAAADRGADHGRHATVHRPQTGRCRCPAARWSRSPARREQAT